VSGVACLETTFMVDLLRRDPRAISKLKDLEDAGERLATTQLNLVELYIGAYRSSDAQAKVGELGELLEGLDVLEFGREECAVCGRIMAGLLSRGESIGTVDVIAGCIALAHGETVITRNVEHYRRIPGLSVESY